MLRTWTFFLASVWLAGAAAGEVRQRVGLDRPPRNIDQFLQVRGRANVLHGHWQPPAVHRPFDGRLTAEAARTGIDDAVTYLRHCQRKDGSIGYQRGLHLAGETSLAALAMLAAGANPLSDSQLAAALDYLAKADHDNTYVRAIRANVWEYALRKVPHDEKIRAALKKDFDWLMEAMNKEGWRYHLRSTDWDNSCSQYGVLGVWAAARAGHQPGEEFWKTCSRHFRTSQRPDGGWSYQSGSSTANMATAGLASMFLVFDMYHGKSFYSAANPRTFTSGDAAAVLKSIERGMAWLGKRGGANNDGYYLYGIERTGVASGRKYIGGRDWFHEGATAVLRAQRAGGSIPTGRWGGPVANTAWCTLFLVYGGAPVAFNKLQYGTGQDWNLNPRDLANLTKHLWSAYERPLNWHSVSIDADADELEAPILFVSGSQAATFTETECLKLREYVQRGGTILAEPSDHSEAFARSMAELLRQMFPGNAYPGRGLRELPGDHGVYTVLKQDWTRRPRLRGASDGSRTFFFLSQEYLSADWQRNRTDSDAFRLAMNVLFYATDLAALEGKFASILPETPPAKKREQVATVARVRYTSAGGHPRDWDAAATCWKQFAPYVRHVTGCELAEHDPVRLGQDDLKGIRLLHVTGRHGLILGPAEQQALRAYVAGGGTVLVDAYAGASAFTAAARREIEAVFGKLDPLGDDDHLAAGRFVGGADLTRNIRFKLPARKLLRARGEDPRGQKLLVACARKRPAVIFSEFGLSGAMAGVENYRSLGYKPASARRVVGNVMAYVMAD